MLTLTISADVPADFATLTGHIAGPELYNRRPGPTATGMS